MSVQITPFLLGSGSAARAIHESLRIIAIAKPDITVLPVRQIARGAAFDTGDAINPVLFIANPHALHADAVLAGERAGFRLIVCEKPVAVSREQIAALRRVKVPVAVCHVYRQTWGVQTLKAMLDAGEFGEVIAIEGRYWQSSTASKALSTGKVRSWKNDTGLSGDADVLFDIATHWADAALYLVGDSPDETSLWLSYANADAPHRDSHVHLQMAFRNGTHALASISKTVHGSPNHFEINVIGSKKYACWQFLDPDRIETGVGTTRSFITRDRSDIGSGHWPFHATGWIEGYIEIIVQAIRSLEDGNSGYPVLADNLALMTLLLDAR